MRHDIQFLRGIAVLAVVLYHAKIGPVANGYLGVDIFFVISGFLITSIVLRGLESSGFSFSQFYLRRARRLLPALYCTLTITTVASYLFLTSREWHDFRHQLYGALSFTSNMVLPFQVGYFDDAAETKPLLHIWSLSLEEQYYLLLPLLLFVATRKSRGVVLLGLALTSFVLCQLFIHRDFSFSWAPHINSANWAFYLLPTRAWELLMGSIVAWCMLKYPSFRVPKILKISSLLGLIALLAYSIDDLALRGNTIAAVLLTSVLLAGTDNWLPRWRVVRLVEKVGDWSYSLYLIHWPLLAFAQIAFLGLVPQHVNIWIVCGALVLSFLQYQTVEQRFRSAPGQQHRRFIVALFVSTLAIVVLSLPPVVVAIAPHSATSIDFEHLRRMNVGFDWRCTTGDMTELSEQCSDSATPKVAVWGDSYAMHLVPGLRQNTETKGSLIQLTLSTCNPIKGLTGIHAGIDLAKTCVEFNSRALDYILSSTSIERVILGSPFGYFYEGYSQFWYEGKAIDRDTELATAVLVDTIRIIQQAGKRVVIVSPLPSADFNVGECLERQATGALLLGRKNCAIDVKTHQERMMPVILALKKVQDETGIKIVWLPDLLCDDVSCRTELGGVPLYRDQGHLSYSGSEALLGNLPIF